MSLMHIGLYIVWLVYFRRTICWRLTMLAMFVLCLDRKGYMNHLTDSHFHDIGKFMFAFSVFDIPIVFSVHR